MRWRREQLKKDAACMYVVTLTRTSMSTGPWHLAYLDSLGSQASTISYCIAIIDAIEAAAVLQSSQWLVRAQLWIW